MVRDSLQNVVSAGEGASIVDIVREKYGQTARSGLTNDHAGVRAIAEAFGYSAEDLASIPAEANMGLSCGNPVALANLREGETVLDLGSGGGLDVFLAARRVGPTGRAIGVDMTPEMIERATTAAKRDGISNVEFKLGRIESLPLPDASVDVVISNCVINLSTDKSAVFREMFRVLKPGGRVAVSDLALRKPLPEEIRNDAMAYVGCVAGAVLIDEYVAAMREAGLANVTVLDANADLNAYASVEGQSGCCSPATASPTPQAATSCCSSSKSVSLKTTSCCSTGHDQKASVHEHVAAITKQYDINAFVASVKVLATRPA